MTIAIRIVAAYLVLLAVAVAVNFIATPLYHPGGDEPYTVWEVLNWFMAVGIVITTAVTFRAKRFVDADDSADLKRYLRASVLFYVSALVLMVFFWNWFSDLSPDNSPDGQFWVVVDTVMPLVTGATGCRLWQLAGERG